jgi:hypothetical protein
MHHDALYWIRFGAIALVFIIVIGCCGRSAMKSCKKQEQLLEEEDVFQDII